MFSLVGLQWSSHMKGQKIFCLVCTGNVAIVTATCSFFGQPKDASLACWALFFFHVEKWYLYPNANFESWISSFNIMCKFKAGRKNKGKRWRKEGRKRGKNKEKLFKQEWKYYFVLLQDNPMIKNKSISTIAKTTISKAKKITGYRRTVRPTDHPTEWRTLI